MGSAFDETTIPTTPSPSSAAFFVMMPTICTVSDIMVPSRTEAGIEMLPTYFHRPSVQARNFSLWFIRPLLEYRPGKYRILRPEGSAMRPVAGKSPFISRKCSIYSCNRPTPVASLLRKERFLIVKQFIASVRTNGPNLRYCLPELRYMQK